MAWKPYDANNSGAPSTGHYYLADDYAQNGQHTLISGSDVVIDLRGHTLTTQGNSRLFMVEGYLAVLDTVGGGRMQSKTSGVAYGGVVLIRENETKGSTFEMHSGTLTVDDDNKSSVAGGIVYVGGDQSAFRMLGGMIAGGSTVKNGSLATYGGAVVVASSTAKAEILGGTIMDCSSVTDGGSIYSVGTTVLKNCRILGGTAEGNGGNIYQSGGSLTMENCEIAYGSAYGAIGGGNIYIQNADLTDNGSTIRDGFAVGGTGNGGGNLLIGAGTHTLTGTTIRGGVSQKYGANILNWAATTTRLIDCEIDGDVRWAGKGLALVGKTKIGLRNNGLNLVGGSATNTINASGLTEGAEIFVSASHGTVFTKDSVNLDYFKPALRTVITQNEDGTLTGSMAASGAEAGYCPHCYDPTSPRKVTWKAYTSKIDAEISESGHYYLSGSCTARFNIAAGADVVIDLNGLNVTSGHRAFVIKKGATLSILDFVGAGKVTGKGGATNNVGWNGGVIYGEGACNLNIYGGSFIYSSQADKHITRGGVIYAPAGSTVNIHGGTLDGSSYNATGTTNLGGAVCLDDGASGFTMTAGRVIGGTVYRGGVMHFGVDNTVNITGGVIAGGTATNGGNIRAAGATYTMRNCAVVGGAATVSGGNVQFTDGKTTVDNCYIANGSGTAAGSYGGNISANGMVEIADSIVTGGRAPKGGNLYVAAVSAVVEMTNCLVTRGEAYIHTASTATTDGNGGNVFASNGVVTINGGEVSFGKAGKAGGNIYAHTGGASTTTYPDAADDILLLTADSTGTAVKLLGGYAKVQGGNIYTDGNSQINDAYISGGKAGTSGQDLYLTKYNAQTSLTLGAGVTGDISMAVPASLLGSPVYGNPIGATVSSGMNANITLEGSYGEPMVLAKDGKLYVGSVSVVDTNGSETWYAENSDAVAACGKGECVKLYTTDDLVLTKDLTVDFNGNQVAVCGNYTVSGMDSSGDGYAVGSGKATWAAAADVKTADITYAPNGNTYIAVTDGASVTYHRLGMALTDIALRPSEQGIYYKAAWSCDSVLDGLIDEYGIVASVEDMPDENFRSEADENEWVAFDSDIADGEKMCSVLIRNIMQQENEASVNKENGEMPIYAIAYVTMTDGTTYVSDGADHSLYSFMELLDAMIQGDPTNYRRFEKAAKEFYAAWEENGMGDWTFNRLKAPQNPNDDNEYNVIMIGSSFCYYYVEELYELLVEAGYENVRVCNVYYSGCPLSSHYNWWVGNQSNYQFYEVDSTGRKQISNAASLEYCLARHNWDVISIQGNGNTRTKGAEVAFQEQLTYHSNLLPYLKSEFPQAKHAWHQTWTYQIGYSSSSYKVTSATQQHNDMLSYRDFALLICEEYDYLRINSGEAWQVVREKYGYDTLCNRLGKGTNHEGDYYHEGDIGGAQLLNACVWFEILTGLDCTEMEYVPVYKYDGKVVENLFDADMIKAAAHEAVQAMKNGGCAVSLEKIP